MDRQQITSCVKQTAIKCKLSFAIHEQHHELDITSAVSRKHGTIHWLAVRNILIEHGFNPEVSTRLMYTFESQHAINESTAALEYYHPFAKFIGNAAPHRRNYSKRS